MNDVPAKSLEERLAIQRAIDRPPLLRAVHKLNHGCGKLVAVFYDYDEIGWDRRYRCQCQTNPLPEGEVLDRAVRRARNGGSAVVKV